MSEPIAFTFSDTLTAGLAAARDRAADFTPAMRSIAALMEEAAQHRFETQSGPDGTPWLPSKRATDTGGKTLIESGRLLGSVTSAFDANSAQAGTNVVYAAIHQFGDNQARAVKAHERTIKQAFGKPLAKATTVSISAFTRTIDMPAREFLGFSAEDTAGIEDILTRHLAGVAA